MILSWRASAPADSKHAAAVAYCVYRSIKRKDPSPELVNFIPFPGTSCTDDLVENGKKYYYVVRAISQGSYEHHFDRGARPNSNGEAEQSFRLRSSAPLCREQASVK